MEGAAHENIARLGAAALESNAARRKRMTATLVGAVVGNLSAFIARAEGIFVSSPNRVDIA